MSHTGRALGRIVDTVSNAIQSRTGPSTFYPTTLNHQKSFKTGWLKKISGVVRSWHRRWVTIKGDQLYYFASSDESKNPLGSIFLPGYRVSECEFNSNEPDKFLFEIAPGGGRFNFSDVHTFCAGSEDDRKEWIRIIRQVIFAEKGGAIFGQSLEETMMYEAKRGNRKVPEIVTMCVEFLRENGLDTEGIFRLPGRTSTVKDLRQAFDCGERPTFRVDDTDVHTVASLLKNYLRELPGTLIPSKYFEDARKIATIDIELDRVSGIQKMSDLIGQIPVSNYNLLHYLCQFLLEITENSSVNKMTALNLGTVFNQSFIVPELDEPAILMGTASVRSKIVVFLISDWKDVFKIEYTDDGSAVRTDELISFEEIADSSLPQNVAQVSESTQNDLLGLELDRSIGSLEDLISGVNNFPTQDEEKVAEATVDSLDIQVDHCNEEPCKDKVPHYVNVPQDMASTLEPSSIPPTTEDSEQVHYRVKRNNSIRNRGGMFMDPETPQPPPRPSKRLTTVTLDEQLPQTNNEESAVLGGIVIAPEYDKPLPDAVSEPAESARISPDGSAEDLSEGQEKDENANTEDIASSTELVTKEQTCDAGIDADNDSVDKPVDVDMDRVDSALDTDTSQFSQDQLQVHITSLNNIIGNLKSKVLDLEKEKRAFKLRHQSKVNEMAKKLDVEKASTGEAVDLIVKLQSDIQKYQMQYGSLK